MISAPSRTMVACWWLGTILMFFIRGAFLLRLASMGTSVAAFMFVTEGCALLFGVSNLLYSKFRDYGSGGVWVPCAYALISLVYPRVANLTLPCALISWFAIGLMVWALFTLRSRFSFGGTSWVDLTECGPYRFVRHPQAVAHVLLVVAALASASDLVSIVRLILVFSLLVSLVLAEEQGLQQVPEYRDYQSRVRWRFFPGVV